MSRQGSRGERATRLCRSQAATTGTRRSLWRRVLASATLATATAVSVGGTGCGGDEGLTSPCPPGKPCSVSLTLLHTSDIHSRLLPYDLVITQADADLGLGALNSVANVGGVARMSSILQRERARADRVMHIDSGDCFQGAPIFNFFNGEPEIRSMSAFGVDAAVIGNHEFDSGAVNVGRQMQKWATYSGLAANYKWEDPNYPNYALLGTIAKPFQVYNQGGLKVAVIGMANLSSLTSLYDQPNKTSITPLNTVEVAQFYVDLLRPQVDLIVMVTHLGLDVDQRMARNTTGIDIIAGGHNHVVINPPQEIQDCQADGLEPGKIWVDDPSLKVDLSQPPPDDERHPDPVGHPWKTFRRCKPRKVVIMHSGAFAKYIGRLDLVVSNDPAEASPTGDPKDYEEANGFEVVSSRYTAFPVDATVPEDPIFVDMLQPYVRGLDIAADLDILAAYSPTEAIRNNPNGGDAPLGNIVATSMWLRLGIQTDFAMTNSTGIRSNLLPGPVSVEQVYNIFPFDNSITKMQLSGKEVQDLFNFVARRSAGRGCSTQVQLAGARVRINCKGCEREEARPLCTRDEDCGEARDGEESGCDTKIGRCRLSACAEHVYIGSLSNSDGSPKTCKADADCASKKDQNDGNINRGQCDTNAGLCLALIQPINRYELATNTYIAQGGSGFRVLQRNTTQNDTRIQQRDALIDFLRQGKPCGWRPAADRPDGLRSCATDNDCAEEGPEYVCACAGKVKANRATGQTACETDGECSPSEGRCVQRLCRDSVANFHDLVCASSPQRAGCLKLLNSCSSSGEECKILACVDERLGNLSDGRVEMIGR